MALDEGVDDKVFVACSFGAAQAALNCGQDADKAFGHTHSVLPEQLHALANVGSQGSECRRQLTGFNQLLKQLQLLRPVG